MVSYFYLDDFEYEEKGVQKSFAQETAGPLLNALIEALGRVDDWVLESIEPAVRAAADKLELGHGKAIHAARLAITGRTWGPGLFELMEVIGRARCVKRLERAAAWVARQHEC
jgi:glutamyl-tRNA synthetase